MATQYCNDTTVNVGELEYVFHDDAQYKGMQCCQHHSAAR